MVTGQRAFQLQSVPETRTPGISLKMTCYQEQYQQSVVAEDQQVYRAVSHLPQPPQALGNGGVDTGVLAPRKGCGTCGVHRMSTLECVNPVPQTPPVLPQPWPVQLTHTGQQIPALQFTTWIHSVSCLKSVLSSENWRQWRRVGGCEHCMQLLIWSDTLACSQCHIPSFILYMFHEGSWEWCCFCWNMLKMNRLSVYDKNQVNFSVS